MKTEILTLIAYALIAYFLSTTVHELGHVICGLLHKWKLIMLVVGPFKLYREDIDSKIKFGLEKNPTYWGGVGGTFPTKEDDGAVDIFAKILLAGPLASLILGVLFIPVFILSKSNLALMIAGVAIGEGIICILPMNIKTGILYNDGTRFKRIVKGGQERAEESALLSIIIRGMLNGDNAIFDEAKLQILCESPDADFKYYGLFYSFLNAKTRNDEDSMNRLRLEAGSLKEKASKYTVAVCVME
ncbi:MAG: hypothetical protein K5686_11085 [Lachnospiraceae bacterium]|nr:hypothetical protein [Lachnospiraceae bacterium]